MEHIPIDASALDVRHNAERSRFEVTLGDAVGVIDYHRRSSAYVMIHTGVPPEYGGQGVADRLVHVALETVKAEGALVVPVCPFIKAYIQRHPEYEPLVAAASDHPAATEEAQ